MTESQEKGETTEPQEKKGWQKKMAIVKEIGKKLGLEDANATWRRDDTCIHLTWTENGKGMLLRVPGEYVSDNPEAVERRIKQMRDNGEAEEAPRD